jgi:hypothetical protein
MLRSSLPGILARLSPGWFSGTILHPNFISGKPKFTSGGAR